MKFPVFALYSTNNRQALVMITEKLAFIYDYRFTFVNYYDDIEKTGSQGYGYSSEIKIL